VAPQLLAVQPVAQLVKVGAPALDVGFRRRRSPPQAFELGASPLQGRRQLHDLTLPGQHPVQFVVGCVKGGAVPGHDVAVARDEHGSGRECRASGKRRGGIRRYVDPLQPLVEHRLGSRVGARDVAAQRLTARDGGIVRGAPARGLVERRLCGWRIAEPRRGLRQLRHRNPVQALAQQRFEGVFPTRLYPHVLPQAPRAQ
jgi:hypothetical protein